MTSSLPQYHLLIYIKWKTDIWRKYDVELFDKNAYFNLPLMLFDIYSKIFDLWLYGHQLE